jgi:hypothetical protein
MSLSVEETVQFGVPPSQDVVELGPRGVNLTCDVEHIDYYAATATSNLEDSPSVTAFAETPDQARQEALLGLRSNYRFQFLSQRSSR